MRGGKSVKKPKLRKKRRDRERKKTFNSKKRKIQKKGEDKSQYYCRETKEKRR